MRSPDHLKYTSDHEWIRCDPQGSVVGITDHAQQQLGDIVYVDLPQVGQRLSKGKPFGTVESVKAVSEIVAPLEGEVIQVNAVLEQAPELINRDPYGEAWMIQIKEDPTSSDRDLMTASEYDTFLASLRSS